MGTEKSRTKANFQKSSTNNIIDLAGNEYFIISEMGVVCVLSYRVPEGRTGQQTAELLQKRVEELGAVKTGNFSVDCDLYQAAQAGIPQRTLQVLHNSEQPASCFCVLDTAGQRCLVADIHMDLLMTKLKDYYEKKNVKMESKGMRYELGDF